MKDVVRLRDDVAAPEALRRMIDAARAEAPGAAATARMMARLDALDRGGGGGGGGGGGAMLPKVALVAGLVVVAAGAWWMLRGRGEEPSPSPSPSTSTSTSPSPDPSPSPSPDPSPSTSTSPSTSPSTSTSTSTSTTHERPYRIERKPDAKPKEAEPTELQLVDAARRQLAASRWTLAYAAALEHARLYPDGVLAEEREAIAVEALIRLGRAADARDRLSSFLRRYPKSSYRKHLERLEAPPP